MSEKTRLSRFVLGSLITVVLAAIIVLASSRPSNSQHDHSLLTGASRADDVLPSDLPPSRSQETSPLPEVPSSPDAAEGAGEPDDSVAPPESAEAFPSRSVEPDRPAFVAAPAGETDAAPAAHLREPDPELLPPKPLPLEPLPPDQEAGKSGAEKSASPVKQKKDRPAKKAEPISHLSRQFARRSAAGAGDKNAKPITLSPLEIYDPLVAMSQEHRDSCLVYVGDALPPNTLADAAGADHEVLKSLGEQLTVVVFWNADNPYAVDQFRELSREVGPLAERGVQAVAIHVGDKSDGYEGLVEQFGQGTLCLVDTDRGYYDQVAKSRLPRTYVLDTDGKILWLDIEYSRSTRRDLQNALHYYLKQ